MTINICNLVFDCFAGFEWDKFLFFTLSAAVVVGAIWIGVKALEYFQ